MGRLSMLNKYRWRINFISSWVLLTDAVLFCYSYPKAWVALLRASTRWLRQPGWFSKPIDSHEFLNIDCFGTKVWGIVNTAHKIPRWSIIFPVPHPYHWPKPFVVGGESMRPFQYCIAILPEVVSVFFFSCCLTTCSFNLTAMSAARKYKWGLTDATLLLTITNTKPEESFLFDNVVMPLRTSCFEIVSE